VESVDSVLVVQLQSWPPGSRTPERVADTLAHSSHPWLFPKGFPYNVIVPWYLISMMDTNNRTVVCVSAWECWPDAALFLSTKLGLSLTRQHAGSVYLSLPKYL
jgi:hypothetical protein